MIILNNLTIPVMKQFAKLENQSYNIYYQLHGEMTERVKVVVPEIVMHLMTYRRANPTLSTGNFIPFACIYKFDCYKNLSICVGFYF
ncbi:MAG TPA: hypothetical protein GXZ27_10195 [Thermoanaerobacterales bacterium]|jgi:hypothetical protein|nr:hypothetical protein [Thermoanaerobacterales bacterium]